MSGQKKKDKYFKLLENKFAAIDLPFKFKDLN